MASYNQTILLGNLTRNPELKFTPNQTAVCTFGMAVNRKWQTQDGQKKEEVCFVDVACFGKRGEALNKYVKKGDPLFVSGRLKYDQWTAQDGTKRSKLSVICEDFQFIGGGERKQGEPPADDGGCSGSDDIPF